MACSLLVYTLKIVLDITLIDSSFQCINKSAKYLLIRFIIWICLLYCYILFPLNHALIFIQVQNSRGSSQMYSLQSTNVMTCVCSFNYVIALDWILIGSHAISLHEPQYGSYFWSSFSSGAICRTSLTFYQHCLPCQMAWASVFPNQWRAETCRVSGVTQWLDVPTAPPITVFQCSFWFGCPPLYRDPVNTQGHRPTAAHLPWLLTARYCAPQISILSVVDQLYSHSSILGYLSSLLSIYLPVLPLIFPCDALLQCLSSRHTTKEHSLCDMYEYVLPTLVCSVYSLSVTQPGTSKAFATPVTKTTPPLTLSSSEFFLFSYSKILCHTPEHSSSL